MSDLTGEIKEWPNWRQEIHLLIIIIFFFSKMHHFVLLVGWPDTADLKHVIVMWFLQ